MLNNNAIARSELVVVGGRLSVLAVRLEELFQAFERTWKCYELNSGIDPSGEVSSIHTACFIRDTFIRDSLYWP